MQFQVVDRASDAQLNELPTAALVTDNWDDWFRYGTMFTLFIFDETGNPNRIGSVKIGQFDMESGQRRPTLPTEFENLEDQFFSLGQDDRYYESLNQLGAETRDEVLTALLDLALAEPARLRRALRENVTKVSLFRSVSLSTLNEQFRRIARGGARLTRYSFVYDAPSLGRARKPSVSFSFEVEPESQPPTNVHVIVGRNGVGKTHLLNGMARALVSTDEETNGGSFRDLESTDPSTSFANLVSVTFSAFDPFDPLTSDQNKKSSVRFSYIGLKRAPSGDDKSSLPKTPQMLGAEFSRSAKLCQKGERAVRWARALRMLESDPIFKDAQVAAMAPSDDEDESSEAAPVTGVFTRLSSGHKIVLLTITRLVETVAERTLVLLDEPEAHLHPPLLSAFIRALSELLIDRNGVAVIATHSPVVVQEVPRRCVWKVRRSGTVSMVERPDIETFGESVGILTREIFGLEVVESGFHRILSESVVGRDSYEQIVSGFSGELGGEAKGIIRGLIADRDQEDNTDVED